VAVVVEDLQQTIILTAEDGDQATDHGSGVEQEQKTQVVQTLVGGPILCGAAMEELVAHHLLLPEAQEEQDLEAAVVEEVALVVSPAEQVETVAMDVQFLYSGEEFL
jgi:hypothetical protein